MNYKRSKYNYKLEENGSTLLFNTLSHRMMISHYPHKLEKILSSSTASELDEQDIDKHRFLVNNGFLISENTDEDIISELEYYNNLFDSTFNLTIMPTEQCNFRCIYCYEKFEHGAMNQYVQDGIINYIKRNIWRYTSIHVSWFGGEPLLEMDSILCISRQINEICNKVHKKFLASMTTNGYLLELEVFKKLLKSKVVSFQITVDGIEEDHDKTRVLANKSKTFQKIMDNLINIKNNVKSTYFIITIRCNLSEESFKNIDKYLQLMHETFGGDSRFTFYFRPVGKWSDIHIKDIRLINNEKEIFEKLLMSQYVLNYDSYVDMLLTGECISKKQNHFIVRANGAISKCTCYLDESILGTLDNTGNIEWDRSKLAKWILPRNLDINCQNCLFTSICHGNSCTANKFALQTVEKDCGYQVNSLDNLLRLLKRENAIHKSIKLIHFDDI